MSSVDDQHASDKSRGRHESPQPAEAAGDATRVSGDDARAGGAKAKVHRTRVSGAWVAVLIGVLILIFLLIFILQNLGNSTIYFLGASGSLPIGVALLFAAIAGAVLVALVGAARIVQLRRQARRSSRTAVR